MLRNASICLLTLCSLLTVASVAHAKDGQRVPTPRGAEIEVQTEFPAGKAPVPVLILAPGTGYHMRLPLMDELARALVKRGVGVVRFDWAYFVRDPKQGKPSDDRSAEIEDLQTVVALARRNPRTRADAVLVAGKSLGSIIAWRVFRADPALAAAVLLTPACNRAPIEEMYPKIAEETRPSLWVAGNRDPVCESTALLRYLSTAKPVPQLAVLRGDHAFETGAQGADAERANLQTLRTAALLVVDFVTATIDARKP